MHFLELERVPTKKFSACPKETKWPLHIEGNNYNFVHMLVHSKSRLKICCTPREIKWLPVATNISKTSY